MAQMEIVAESVTKTDVHELIDRALRVPSLQKIKLRKRQKY